MPPDQRLIMIVAPGNRLRYVAAMGDAVHVVESQPMPIPLIGPPHVTLRPDLLDHEFNQLGVPITRKAPKIQRNAPCPCGSGKKAKRCCPSP